MRAAALDDGRRARQGRAGERGGRVELIADAIGKTAKRTAKTDALFFPMESDRDPAHDAVVCAFAIPNFFPEEDGAVVADMGAAPSGAGPRPAGRLPHPARGRHQRGAKEKPETLRDDVRRVLREARVGSPVSVIAAATSVEFRVREAPMSNWRCRNAWNCAAGRRIFGSYRRAFVNIVLMSAMGWSG